MDTLINIGLAFLIALPIWYFIARRKRTEPLPQERNIVYKPLKIKISNLSPQITSEDLRELFEEYGEVYSAKVIMDNNTNHSMGFGIIEMSNSRENGWEAQQAIAELDKAEYDGYVIRVEVAEKEIDDYTPNTISITCPHCKNPNTKKLRECEWCGNEIH